MKKWRSLEERKKVLKLYYNGGKTQKEVAEKAGMSYQQYQRLENPHKTNPTLETLYKLQKVFNRPFLAL